MYPIVTFAELIARNPIRLMRYPHPYKNKNVDFIMYN